MPRWTNEDTWLPQIKAAAEKYGVPYTLVQAVIARESGFNPSAMRGEPQLNDASYGLMQILLSTAKGEGYTGTGQGLLDPASNIEYGTRYLAEQYNRAGGNPAGAASAYNGGWRPSLGFGAPATTAVRICLARNQTTGDCIKWRDVKPGEYGNAEHVAAVLSNLDYFESKRVATTGVTQYVAPTTETGAVNPKLIAVLAGVLLGLLALRSKGR